jgi:lactate 2-monooxygenase
VPPGVSDSGPERQRQIFLDGLRGRTPVVPVQPAALEERARRVMTREGFAYVAGGAGAEVTVRANRAAFERWAIVPRMLRDVAVRDAAVELFGDRLPAPVLLAPVGVLEMAHPQADVAVAGAAARVGVPMIFSSQASHPMEACAAAMGDRPRWFQLYWNAVDAVMESFVRRAEACACRAIVLTVDTTMLAWRPRDLDLGYLPFLHGRGIADYVSDPAFRAGLAGPLAGAPSPPSVGPITWSLVKAVVGMARRYPGGWLRNLRSGEAGAAVRRFAATFPRPSLTWADLPRLRALTKLPLVLKGILHPDDARRALDAGVDGLIVSNHGGRQVDGAIATLDALPAVVEAVGGRVPVLLDSGIRTGADVFKALALGAAAVCIGRPFVYGLALAGAAGVTAVIENLLADFDLTLALAGCRTVRDISREMVRPTPNHLAPVRGSPAAYRPA